MVTVVELVTAGEPTPFVARMANVNAPAVVGVPESEPVVASSVTPVGSAPDARSNVGVGDPVAAELYEYAVPKTPVAGGADAVNTGSALIVTVVEPVTAGEPKPLLARTVNVN